MLGFEIELLVLVDVDGRPVPEKIPLGTWGTQQVMLTIDHSSRVETPALVTAARATSRLVPYRKGGLRLGQYDLPDGHESRYVVDAGLADPRTAAGFTSLPREWLEPDGWLLAEQALTVGEVPVPAWHDEVSSAGRGYPSAIRNGDMPGVVEALTSVRDRTGQWLAVVRPVPAEEHRRRELANATRIIAAVNAEAQAHLTYWTGQVMPSGARQYRASFVGGATDWSEEHPVEHFLGRDSYHCILELVTRPYAVEALAEGQALVTAVTEAGQLAAQIVTATSGLTLRALLSTTGAAVANPDTYIGNGACNQEAVDASIQATFAVDLAQIPSLFRTLIPPIIRLRSGPEGFILKHQSDIHTGDDHGLPVYTYRAHTLACTAPDVATTILKSVATPNTSEIADHDGLTCLRGLLTLVCQYLVMGRHFSVQGPELDKNIVPLLSRTDLADLYRELVGPTEKRWVALHRSELVTAILAGTGRRPDSMLFTNETETWQGTARPPLDLTCRQFVENVLEGAADGVTHHLDEGIFKEMPAEEIHPPGSPLATEPRRGPVFELRNMVPLPSWGGLDDRFPVDRWRPLAEYLVGALRALNSRTDDPTHDLRWFTSRTEVAATSWWV